MSESSKIVKQWKVPSSKGDKEYTITLNDKDEYSCSCPNWIYRRAQCKHIQAVQDGEYDGEEQKDLPETMPGNVKEVQLKVDDKGKIERVLVPLIPFGETHFLATIIYDLLAIGYSWGYLKKRYHILPQWKKRAVTEYIKTRGRKICGPWQEGKGYVGYETISI